MKLPTHYYQPLLTVSTTEESIKSGLSQFDDEVNIIVYTEKGPLLMHAKHTELLEKPKVSCGEL